MAVEQLDASGVLDVDDLDDELVRAHGNAR
jgi:hypothetical protein